MKISSGNFRKFLLIFPEISIYLLKNFFTEYIFNVMQTRYSKENSVRPSVRPSVTRVIPDKTEERSVQIFIPYERTFILVF